MNDIINELSLENQDNHSLYLQRMADSTQHSTKSMIPIYSKPGRILDVGCGDGVLMSFIRKEHPESIIEGIEINTVSAAEAREKGFTVYEEDFIAFAETHQHMYDTVIFSSMLHEVSSYEKSEEDRFSAVPIHRFLKAAHDVLKPDGKLIIRDGLKFPADRTMKLTYSNPMVAVMFTRFLKESPVPAYHTGRVYEDTIVAPGSCLKEFLLTYTWGEASWHREVLEQYGILTCGEWLNAVMQNGFLVNRHSTSGEEYLKFLSKDFVNSIELHDLLTEVTVLIVATPVQKSNTRSAQ